MICYEQIVNLFVKILFITPMQETETKNDDNHGTANCNDNEVLSSADDFWLWKPARRPNRKPVTVIRSLTSYNNCRCPKSWEHDPPHDLRDDDLHLLGEDEQHELPIEGNY